MKYILKSKAVLILVMMGVAIVLLALLFGRTKPVEIGEIETFSFNYQSESTVDGSAHYTLNLEDGIYIASVKPVNVPSEEAQTFAVDKSFARELEQILIDNAVGKWNGFHKTNKRVMDGRSFSLYLTMADGTSVDAHGYMKWPKNFTAMCDAVKALFDAHIPQ